MTNKETVTLDQSGAVMTIDQDGLSMPADYSFECVNDYVHSHDRHYEELQWLALGMANEIEKLRKDAERYRWLSQRLVGASFDWDDEGMTTLAFEIPDGVSIGADCDKNIDEAMQESKP